MNGPPKDIQPSQLWLKLQELPRPSKKVDFPRRGEDGQPIGQLSMRILTQEEQMICAAAAEEVARKHIKDGKREQFGYDQLYTDAYLVEVLFRSCRNNDNADAPAFPTPNNIRERLTTDECGALYRHYLTVQMELGPIVYYMSDEEMDAWVERLAEGGSAFPFDLLGSEQQKVLLRHMASQLRGYQTDSFSAGSPPEESTTREQPSAAPKQESE